jgi:hypothetical protein
MIKWWPGGRARCPVTCFSGAVADHLMADLDVLLERLVLDPQTALLQRIADGHEQAIGALERLVEEVGRAALDRLDRRAGGAVARDHHDRHGLVHRSQARQHVHPVHARHLDVEQHQVGAVALRQHQAFRPGRGADEVVAVVFERHAQRITDRRVVVDDENPRLGHRLEARGPTPAPDALAPQRSRVSRTGRGRHHRSSTRTVFSCRCCSSGE